MRGRLAGWGGSWSVVVEGGFDGPCRMKSGRNAPAVAGSGAWTFRTELAARRFAKRKNIQLEEPT